MNVELLVAADAGMLLFKKKKISFGNMSREVRRVSSLLYSLKQPESTASVFSCPAQNIYTKSQKNCYHISRTIIRHNNPGRGAEAL